MTKRNKLDEFRLHHIAKQVKALREEGAGVVLVVSGAVACGSDCQKDGSELVKRAVAGVGQVRLISKLNEIFGDNSIQIAQLLITTGDIYSFSQKQKIKELLEVYMNEYIVPVLNENDVIDLNSFGGNDFLAEEIAKIIQASEVLILSTKKGSKFGIGGGETKEKVMQSLLEHDIQAAILNGKTANCILNYL